MDPIETITGPVSSLMRDDIDTDQIIPKQFLKRVERTGFGEFLFYDWAKEAGWTCRPTRSSSRAATSDVARHARWSRQTRAPTRESP